jgi:hypothetical protein
MANEFKHKDPGTELTQAEFIASDGTGHIFDGQAAGDVLYASSTTVLKNLAKATDGNVLELASGLPAWTASPTIGSTSWANANHAHGASNSGGTLNTSALGAGTLAVGRGGTGATTLTDKAVLISQDTGTDTVGSVALTTSGQIIIGGSSGPAAATLTAGAGIDITNGDGSISIVAETAADDNPGIAELATTAEIDTGDDTGRVITPKALADSNFGERVIQMVVVDFATALTTGDGKFYFHVPSTLNGFNIVDVHAEVITVATGSTIIIDLYNVTHSADILSTNLTIDASESGSDTAAAAAAIDTGEDDLATNDVIRVDIDQIGSSNTGVGLIVTLICRLP